MASFFFSLCLRLLCKITFENIWLAHHFMVMRIIGNVDNDTLQLIHCRKRMLMYYVIHTSVGRDYHFLTYTFLHACSVNKVPVAYFDGAIVLVFRRNQAELLGKPLRYRHERASVVRFRPPGAKSQLSIFLSHK